MVQGKKKMVVRGGYVFFRGSNRFEPGAVVEVTEEEIKAQGWKLEPVLGQSPVVVTKGEEGVRVSRPKL